MTKIIKTAKAIHKAKTIKNFLVVLIGSMCVIGPALASTGLSVFSDELARQALLTRVGFGVQSPAYCSHIDCEKMRSILGTELNAPPLQSDSCVNKDCAKLNKLLDELKYSTNPKIRMNAAYALAGYPSEQTAVHLALAQALFDKEVQVRRNAAYALGQCQKVYDRRVLEAMAWTVLIEIDQRTRRNAIYSIGEWGKSRDPILVEALEYVLFFDPNSTMRRSVVASLNEMGKTCWEVMGEFIYCVTENYADQFLY